MAYLKVDLAWITGGAAAHEATQRTVLTMPLTAEDVRDGVRTFSGRTLLAAAHVNGDRGSWQGVS